MSINDNQVSPQNVERMPKYLSLIKNVFEFDYLKIDKILNQVYHANDLVDLISEAEAYVEDMNLESKDEFLGLLNQEKEVISFSQVSAVTVIHV